MMQSHSAKESSKAVLASLREFKGVRKSLKQFEIQFEKRTGNEGLVASTRDYADRIRFAFFRRVLVIFRWQCTSHHGHLRLNHPEMLPEPTARPENGTLEERCFRSSRRARLEAFGG